jgi:hypothetical protein
LSDPYQPIELRPTAAGCSALLFAVPVLYALAAPLLVREWGFAVIRVGLLILPLASLLGLVAGIIAMRRRDRGLFVLVITALNGALFLSCVAAVVLVILR